MFMIMLVLDDARHLDDVLAAWSRAGAASPTLVESMGELRRRSPLGLVHARRNIENLGIETERANFTLFAIVPSEEVAQQCLAAIESVVGDLAVSGAGLWAAWPLAFVKGLPGHGTDSGAD